MIRRATLEDMNDILSVIQIAKEYMKVNGNGSQWAGDYPGRKDFEEDIRKEQLYVCYEGKEIYGVFAFAIGEDRCYRTIEDGNWLNDEPYGTLHRIGASGTRKGVFQEAVTFAKTKKNQLRIDTHTDNKTMQHLIEKCGFCRCGIVYMEDRSPRIAYQYDGAKGEE